MLTHGIPSFLLVQDSDMIIAMDEWQSMSMAPMRSSNMLQGLVRMANMPAVLQVLNMMLNMEKEQKQARDMGGQSRQGVQWQRQRIIGRGWFKG